MCGSSDVPDKPRVLIIDAGYAGLTLAHALPRQNWHVDIVDRLHPPRRESFLHGSIHVPAARQILPLILGSAADALLENQEDDHFPEQALLSLLRKHVPVHYHHCVQEIHSGTNNETKTARVGTT